MITKTEVKSELLLHQQHLIDDLSKMLDSHKEGADIDEEDTLDPDDLSHQNEATVASYELKARVEHAISDLNYIKNWNLEPSNEVNEYAIVKTQEVNFIIGIATLPFQFKAENYVGISTNAPIYQMMKGKKQGDAFNFGTYHYEIDAIL